MFKKKVEWKGKNKRNEGKKTGKYVEPQESVVRRNKRGREGGRDEGGKDGGKDGVKRRACRWWILSQTRKKNGPETRGLRRKNKLQG